MKKLLLLILPLFFLCGFTHAKKPKLARALWFLMERQDQLEKQPNDSVVVTYNVVHSHAYPNYPNFDSRPTPHIVITVKNRTERTVYVDLQHSFAIINEELYPLYIASSEVTTQSNTTSVGLNLGLVGVGSAGTSASTKIIHAERFVNIPGETKKTIDIPLTKWNAPMKLNNVDGEIYTRTLSYAETNPNNKEYNPPYSLINQNFIHYGEVLTYNDDENPFVLDMRLCYSFSEDMKPNYTQKSVYYTKHIVGSDYLKGGSFFISVSAERARKIFPELDSYDAGPNKLQFHIWVPYPGFM